MVRHPAARGGSRFRSDHSSSQAQGARSERAGGGLNRGNRDDGVPCRSGASRSTPKSSKNRPCRRPSPTPHSRMVRARLKPQVCTSRRLRMLLCFFRWVRRIRRFRTRERRSVRSVLSRNASGVTAFPASSPIGIDRLFFVGLSLPVASAAIRLAHIAADIHLLLRPAGSAAVASCPGHDLAHPLVVDLFFGCWSSLRPRRLPVLLDDRLDDRRKSPRSPPWSVRPTIAAFQVHGMLGLVGQVGAAILHPGDLRIRIVRVPPVVVRTLVFASLS